MNLFSFSSPNCGRRKLFGINTGWAFSRNSSLVPSQPHEQVHLPHCWNDHDTFIPGTRYYQGPGTYQRAFERPHASDQDTLWHLVTEGFYGTGDVRLNHQRTWRVDGQYLGVYLDIDSFLVDGTNQIDVSLTNAYQRHVLPGKKQPDFHLYGGLSGRCYLMRLPRLHLDHRDIHIRCENPLADTPRVSVSGTLHNRYERSVDAALRLVLVEPGGEELEVAGKNIQLSAGVTSRETCTFEVPARRLWTLDDPNLYTLELRLEENGETHDGLRERFGLREARFDGQDGFFLNGERVALQGGNRHESMPGFGRALPEFLHREDAQQMKELGFNFVRLSHYPQHPAFLDACDAEGLLVCAELATWKSVRPGPWQKAAERQLRALLLRDRNHPSIITWCVGNESRSRLAYTRFNRVIGELDAGRPSLYAENHLDRGKRWRTLAIPDVLGVNYEVDKLEAAHRLSKTGAILVSEMSNSPRTYRGDWNTEVEQVERFERDLAHLEGKPYCAGYALWSFCDYATQRKHRFQRHPGVVDCWRLPKMSAAYIQARALGQPFVALFGSWAKQGPAQDRSIHIFTNLEEVVLQSGGREVFHAEGEIHHVTSLPFTEEELVARATGSLGTAEARLLPWGQPHALQLVLDDLSFTHDVYPTRSVGIRVVDNEDRVVADCTREIKIGVGGPATGCFTGPSPEVNIASGTGRFFVIEQGEEGEVILTATSEGLKEGELSFHAEGLHARTVEEL